MTTLFRRLLVLLALAFAQGASAETYPSRPIRMIVPFAAGGPTDVIARIVAQKLSETWGQQIYVENVPGGGGNTGVATAARAAPDGYTILVVSTGFLVNPSMYAKVPYDPIKDFSPVTLVASSPNAMLSVYPEVPAKKRGRADRPHQSQSGQVQLCAARHRFDPASCGRAVQAQVLPRSGDGAVQRCGACHQFHHGGHTPITFTALPPAMANIRDGRLRGLAVLSRKRAAALPDVPTMAEAGVPDQESDTLTGVVVPIGTPQEIVDRWHDEIARVVAAPEVKQRLQDLGFDPVADTPAEFGARIKSEIARWAKVIQDANIKAD